MTSNLKWARTNNPDDETYTQVSGNPLDKMPAGIYIPYKNITGFFFDRTNLSDEILLEFDQGPAISVSKEIAKFWTLKDKYQALGLPHKRGFLMYGPPGTGKTGIVRQICASVANDNGLAIICQPPGSQVREAIEQIYKVEPNRNIIIVMEDIDSIINNYGDQEITDIMDGIQAQKQGVVFLATTNYPSRIPPRLRDRPSRFDTVIEISAPCDSIREKYLKNIGFKLSNKLIKDIVKNTKGKSFAHLKEMAIAISLYDMTIPQVLERFEKMHNVPSYNTVDLTLGEDEKD